ncbi:hypothetical protein THRCLA_04065 [Thraustotheca clavata]|uniref:Tetratricopeptide repeat protein 29 n=1 Tax=Thraustotheca clavata TaxID=74557 RepID=A0A1W0A026_9STRA|nr:hypothetical protein THRCLA_04065 [Thraustotheca clavata]
MVTTRNFRVHWNFNDPQATERVFQELIASTSSPIEKLLLQTQVARTYGLRDQFDQAKQVLDAIEAQSHGLECTLVDAAELKVRLHLERGRMLRSSKKPEEARPEFLKAFQVAQDNKMDELAIDAIHMIALVVNANEALTWTQRGFELAKESEDLNARNWDAALANNIGWTYHDQGEFNKALEYWKIALTAYERIGKADNIRIAKWMIARGYRSLKQHDQALEILHELEKNPSSDGYVFEELGENYLALGQADKTKPYFAKAYSLLCDDKYVEADRLNRMQTLSK